MAPSPTQNTALVLAERPERGPITDKTFRLETTPLPPLKDGEVLVRVEYVSIVSLPSAFKASEKLALPRVVSRSDQTDDDNDMVTQDPTMRNWLNDARSYMEPIKIGAAMRAPGIGRVIASKTKEYASGDLVSLRCSSPLSILLDPRSIPWFVFWPGLRIHELAGILARFRQTD